MPDTNPLFDDLGIQPKATDVDNPLFADLGITKAKAATPDDNLDVSAHPVTDEVGQIGKNIAKQLPRNIATGIGKLADLPGQIWDLAFHPEGDAAPTDIGTQIATKASNKLEQAVPSLQPVNQGPLERVVGAGFEALPSAALGGAEAIIPTMASGAASQTAKEAGAGPVGQFVAGLSPFAPSAVAATVRGLARGGAEGAANTAENLNTAEQAGIKLSPGQATENPALRATETASAALPGGGPLRDTRGAGINQQAEESVSNIVKKLAPDLNQKPPTPTQAGETVQAGVSKRIDKLNDETSEAKQAMETAVGGKDLPMAAPKLQAAIEKVTGPTGVQDVDNLVTGAKTKAIAKTVNAVAETPKVSTSYSTDGEGAHVVSSPNGETHAVETATGDLKVTRSDTNEAARGQGEGTARLGTLAQAATSKGKNLVSDISVSPAEAAAYEKLGRQGWEVQKNPNAEVNPATGNTISDSPKNPVYTVKAPKTIGTGSATNGNSAERQFTGEWTYNPKTGQSEPVTTGSGNIGPGTEAQSAILNEATPHTFDSLRQLRTLIGRGIRSTRDPGQQGQLKQLYGAVSDDLQDGVRQVGPEAESAYGLFNSVAKQNAGIQKTLVKAVTKAGGPEAVFKAAINGSKDGASKISPIMESLDSDGQNLLRATVIHRMGRAGGAADAPFNANTFLTNWKGMSTEAKNVLFNSGTGAATGQLRTSLDSLGKTLDLLKGQGYIKSGLAAGVEQGVSKYAHAGAAGLMMLVADKALESGAHVLSGNVGAAAATVGGALTAAAVNPILSRVLTNPKTAAWLAQTTKAPSGMMPVLLNQLANMGKTDPDARDLGNLISQSTGNRDAPTAQVAPPKVASQVAGGTVYPQINRTAGMQKLPGGGYGIPPESF